MCEVFSEVTSLPTGVVNVFMEVGSAAARVMIGGSHAAEPTHTEEVRKWMFHELTRIIVRQASAERYPQ